MAPELKPACGKCGAPLRHGAADARICSYACAFSARSANAMGGLRPNCGGELPPRPRRLPRAG